MRQAAFSQYLFAPVSRIVPPDGSAVPVNLHRGSEKDEPASDAGAVMVVPDAQAQMLAPHPQQRFADRTVYLVSFLLMATVICWSIVDARVRIAKLERVVNYLYMKSLA